MIQLAQIVLGGLLQGGIYALVALGFCLVYRVTGAINLAQGAFCVVGALLAFTLQETWGVPGLMALVCATIATAALGAAIGRVTFVPGLRRLGPGGLFILTAGLLILLQGLVLAIWGSEPYALPPLSGERPVVLGKLRVPTQAFWIAGITLVTTLGLWFTLTRTRLGLALRACADNRFAASVVGIDVTRMALLSFGLAAGIAALAGIAVAPITSIEFTTSGLFTNYGFIAVAIGGLSSFLGAVVGGFLLGLSSQLAAGYLTSLFSTVIALGLLMIVLLWRPNGLFRPAFQRRVDVRDADHLAPVLLLFDRRLRLALVAVSLVALALPPLLLSSSDLGVLALAGIVFIAVIGLDLVLGFAGQISLGQAAFMAIGGYAAALLTTRYGLASLPALVAGVVLAAACGFGLTALTMRLRGTFLALATLAFGLMVDSLLVGLTDVTGGTSGIAGIPSLSLAGLAISTPLRAYVLVASLIVVICLVLSNALRGDFGRTAKAVRADQIAAAALGVRVRRTKLVMGTLAAAFGGLAGALYAFQFHFLSPDMVGTQRSFEMLAMLVVGGEGTLIGPLVGVLLIVFLPLVAQSLAVFMTAFEGLLLVVFMLWLPHGIYGTSMARLGRARQAARDREARAIAARPTGTAAIRRRRHDEVALDVKALSKRFGGLEAMKSVSFTVSSGTVTAIIGPNGAGKSTLFNLMTGLYQPDSGSVELFGRPLAGLASEDVAALGLVRTFQSARMFPGLSVRENVLLGAHLHASRGTEAELVGRADALLALTGLSVFRDSEATALPMGAQKQVEVLRALMARPRVLLLDEPAAGLNDTETADLAELVADIRELGTTVVVVEHNLDFVMRVADRVIVLDAGGLLAAGAPQEVRQDERVIEAYIGAEQAA